MMFHHTNHESVPIATVLELELARRASLIDEEAHQLRVIEVATEVSASIVAEAKRSTTDGAIIDKDTTDGVPTSVGAGFKKPNPPAS